MLFNNEGTIIQKEIQSNAEESNRKLKSIYDSYVTDKDMLKSLRERYQRQREILEAEEFQIRQKRDMIQELTCELHKLKVKQEMAQTQCKRRNIEINDYIFQL